MAILADIALVIALAVLVGFYVSWRATRLDRLHARVETARAVLDATLLRRSAAALELAGSGLLDPATGLILAGAAHDARAAQDGERELAESDLSRAVRAVFDQPDFRELLSVRRPAADLLADLEAACHQVFIARKFYNDAVAITRSGRRRPLARWLRLAGGAPLPGFFEMDDAPPAPEGADDGGDIPHLTG